MTSAKTKTKLWPPIHKLTYTNGGTGLQVACMVNGERIRETFKTVKEAETRAAQIRQQRDNEGAAAFTLPSAARVEAVNCGEMLKPYNATITEAVTYYVEHVLKFRNAPPVSELVKSMVAEAESAGRREDTSKTYAIAWKDSPAPSANGSLRESVLPS